MHDLLLSSIPELTVNKTHTDKEQRRRRRQRRPQSRGSGDGGRSGATGRARLRVTAAAEAAAAAAAATATTRSASPAEHGDSLCPWLPRLAQPEEPPALGANGPTRERVSGLAGPYRLRGHTAAE
uniref:Uncharacterized protein n=1 Tax=Rousettus aegyptiacus TaxID=9407 RepID=A0A7J8BRS2_ROUAE|nr:hypothetical protein HJG63_009593 [Rousettus aegyptiacus]